jgi:uncharacterized phage protein gp47/JayE
MPFKRPTLGELRTRVSGNYRARFPGADTNLRQSPDRGLVEVIAAASDEDLAYLDWQQRQLFLFSADVEYLERWAAQKGLGRKAATKGQGTITLTGAAGTAPAGSQLLTGNGVSVVTLAAATLVGGTVTVAAQASVGGKTGNLGIGTALTFVGTPAGFADASTVATDFAGGVDAESDASLRLRALRAFAQPSFGGNQNDWQNAALAVPSVTRIFTAPATPTPGSVTLWPLFDDLRANGIPIGTNAYYRPGTGLSAGIAGTGDQRLVLDTILATRPICAHLYVTALVAQPIAITISNLTNDTAVVRAAIATEFANMLKRRAAPSGAGYTISRSWIAEAVARAAGENSHDLTVPADNTAIAAGSLATPGAITYV